MPIIENLPVSDEEKRQLVVQLVSGKRVIVKKADGKYIRIVPMNSKDAEPCEKSS